MGRNMHEIIFVCLAKNCERTLENLFLTMRCLKKLNIKCASIIGENSSTDNTRATIIKAFPDDVFLCDTSFVSCYSNRLERLAMAREAVKSEIVKKIGMARFVCVADLDNVMANPVCYLSVVEAIKNLNERDDIFAVSATSSPWYYDLLPYKSENHNFSGLEAKVKKAQKNFLTYYAFHQHNIYKYQKEITCYGSHLVDSAFNGICIYRYSEYLLGSYICSSSFCESEHIAFNNSIQQKIGKKILVSKSLCVKTPAEHGPSDFVNFYIDRVFKFLRQ